MKILITRPDFGRDFNKVYEVTQYPYFYGDQKGAKTDYGIFLEGEYVIVDSDGAFFMSREEVLESTLCAIAFDFGRSPLLGAFDVPEDMPPGLMDLNLLNIMAKVEVWESKLSAYEVEERRKAVEAANEAVDAANEAVDAGVLKILDCITAFVKAHPKKTAKPELNMGED